MGAVTLTYSLGENSQSYSFMLYALFHIYVVFHKEVLNTEHKRGKE